jgi:hypothetical protein
MKYRITGIVAALVLTLVLTPSAFAQQSVPLTKEEKAAAEAQKKAAAAEAKRLADAEKKAAAEAKKLAEAEKKAAEKKRKEEERALKNRPKNSDIENIGNRDINKGGFKPMTPGLESEIAMGRSAARELEQSVNLLNDPVVNEYVNRVGQNIVRNSDAKVPFTIKVIESDEINAVSLPGGFFYVNTGLILAADDESELAGVMAHEIAHVTARHAAEMQGKASFFNIISMPAMLLGGLPGFILQQAASIGVPATFLAFGRKAEGEADYLGLQYLYAAGYDPGAAVSFFEKLQARESARKKVSGLFETHPQTEDRVAETKKNIELILPPREQYLVTTSEFQKVKALLAQLQADRPERDRGPSLRQPNRRRVPQDDEDRTERDGGRPEPSTTDDEGPPAASASGASTVAPD